MPDSIAVNRDHYDKVSMAWTYLMGKCFHWGYFPASEVQTLDQATASLVSRMAAGMPLVRGNEVLDVGCGIGEPAFQLSREFGVSVTAISISDSGIRIAEENARKAKFSANVRFAKRNALNNEFANESFDHVWMMEMSHLLPDKQALLSESARVLKDGGSFALCDLTFRREPSLKELSGMRVELRAMERAFGVASLKTADFYEKTFRNCGLSVEAVEDVSDRVSQTAVHWLENAEKFREQLVKLIGEKALDDFSASCQALTRLYAQKIWGYHIFWARKR